MPLKFTNPIEKKNRIKLYGQMNLGVYRILINKVLARNLSIIVKSTLTFMAFSKSKIYSFMYVK